MRLIFKLLAFPFVLVTGLLYLVCKFLVIASGAVLGILSGIVFLASLVLFFTAGMFIIIHTSRQNTRRNTAYGIIFDVIFPLYTGLPSILYTYSSMPANTTRYAMPMLNIFLIKLFSLFIIINSLLLTLYY